MFYFNFHIYEIQSYFSSEKDMLLWYSIIFKAIISSVHFLVDTSRCISDHS